MRRLLSLQFSPFDMSSLFSKSAVTTIAVVVTFHPDAERLIEGLQAILPQVDEVVVVDNGSGPAALETISSMDRVNLLRLETNGGIAHAQNCGIVWARSRRAAFVLLLDQDSVADASMVDCLRQEHDRLAATGIKVGAVGPAHIDEFGAARPRFTRFRWARHLQVEVPPGASSVPCDMLIASGTLIPVAALDKVGAMNESLFIDKVDTEWCLRVRRAGLGITACLGPSCLTGSAKAR